MKPDPRPIRLRITGGACVHDSHIVDAETGRELRGVVAVDFSLSTQEDGGLGRCRITLVDFDYDLEIAAVARRFGLPPRPFVAWFLRPQPWWVNASGAALVLAFFGAVAAVSLP